MKIAVFVRRYQRGARRLDRQRCAFTSSHVQDEARDSAHATPAPVGALRYSAAQLQLRCFVDLPWSPPIPVMLQFVMIRVWFRKMHGLMRRSLASACGVVIVTRLALQAAAQPFHRDDWLQDLVQVRQAFATKYANLEWAQLDSAARLSDLLDQTEDRINKADNDADARAAFDRLARRLGDGHVLFDWPKTPNTAEPSSGLSNPCRDYDASRAASPVMAAAAGYAPLQTPQSGIFPAGMLTVSGRKLGVIEIGLIGAGARPELCMQALAAIYLRAGDHCDDACVEHVNRWTNSRYTEAFAAQIKALKAAGATALLVDITGNGGGNEWADAAARMLTPKRLVSEQMAFVRGAQWSNNLLALEATLRRDAAAASGSDRAMLLRFADQAHEKAAIAATPCESGALWLGDEPSCSWLGQGFSVTGPLASADPIALRGKPWAQDVFIPMEFPFEEGLWRGPLMILVDGATESSAEEFAAVLQDNRAGLIIGATTYGAGCGHTDGSEPTVLLHSGGRLALPDCVYVRADGTNEVRGVVPDLLIGFRRSDNAKHRSADVLARLPEALQYWSIRQKP